MTEDVSEGRSAARRLACALCAVLLLACSQDDPAEDGGDGDGDGDSAADGADAGASGVAPTPPGVAPTPPGVAPTPPTPPSGDAIEGTLHFPMADGATWVYEHAGGDTPWTETVTMTAVEHEGGPAMETIDTAGPSGSHSVSVFVQDGDAVRRVYKEIITGQFLESAVTYDPGFTRFDERWIDEGEGFSERLEYDRVEVDGQGTVLRDGVRAHTFTLEALGVEVTVPAGTFTDCAKVRRERERDVADPIAEDDDKNFWFCPGIGKVRQEDPLTGKTEELASCDVPGGACP